MKKAVLVISFGTSYKETREKNITGCEQKIAAAFDEYDLVRAFTSDKIIQKIAREEGIQIDNPVQALEKLYRLGYQKVVIQPLYIVGGEEYTKLKMQVQGYAHKFQTITLGTPLLEDISDYKSVTLAIQSELPKLKKGEGVVFMGHGTVHNAQCTYGMLADRIAQENIKVYLGTMNDSKALDQIIDKLTKDQVSTVYLMPFMLVAGNHALKDMIGEGANTWQTILETKGFNVKVLLKGLGENIGIQECFVTHAKMARKGGCYELSGNRC